MKKLQIEGEIFISQFLIVLIRIRIRNTDPIWIRIHTTGIKYR